jgi:hypothetical protein
MDLGRPLYVFANVLYSLPQAETLSRNRRVESFCLSTKLLTAGPEQLRAAKVKPTGRHSLVIDDFPRGWHDWYVLNGANPHHWQFWTRKVTDPMWRGPDGAKLVIEVKSSKPNKMVVIVQENTWRRYRGRRNEYFAEASLKGSGGWEDVNLAASDFKSEKGKTLKSWAELDELGFRAYADVTRDGKPVRLGGRWDGPVPQFRSVRWVRE